MANHIKPTTYRQPRPERTDPFWVRLRNRDLAAEPHHRCHGGECDLPDTPPARHDPDTQCMWMFTYTGERVCACEMCSDRVGRRKITKRRRREDRAEIAQQLATEVVPASVCRCPCHETPDHCVICFNDWADLCVRDGNG